MTLQYSTPIPAKVTDKWGHQLPMHDEMVKTLTENGYGWLLAGCATGKSATALRIGDTLKAERILVLTTAAAMTGTWPKEIKTHTAKSTVSMLTLDTGTSKQKTANLRKAFAEWNKHKSTTFIVIVNYETASIIADDLKAIGFDYAIADESQKLKSHDSKQSVTLARACAAIPYRMAMTGTGWSDRPTDVYGQVRWLNPDVKGAKTCHSRILSTWGSFMYQYCNTYDMGNGVQIIKSYKNLDKLGALLKPFTYYVESEAVLTLPEKQQIFRDVPLEGELRRLYHELENEMLATFGPDYLVADNQLVCELRLHQLTGGFVMPYAVDSEGRYKPTAAVATMVDHPSADNKLKALLDIMDEIGDEPVVIFTQFKADVGKIAAALAKRGKVIKLLTGDTKEHVAFQEGQGDVLIANIAAGNAGITLTRARYVIYYTVGVSRTMFDQSEWRVRRPDSKHDIDLPVVEFFIRMTGTIDDTLWQRMTTKADLENQVLEGMLKPGVQLVHAWGTMAGSEEQEAAILRMAGFAD